MKNSTKIIAFLMIGISMLNFSVIPAKAKIHIIKQTPKVSAPTITSISKYSAQNNNSPFLTGLTVKNTDVMVYVDGSYVENAVVSETNTETNSFYYFPKKELLPGNHDVMLIAKDRTSLVLSPPTSRIDFIIESLPAPTLVSPDNLLPIGTPKPRIAGLAKSGTFVEFFIDGVYNGKTEILTHDSGTANFAYKPFLNLKPGSHIVQARSGDPSGKKSPLSKELKFTVENPYPAPIALDPAVVKAESYDQPEISGLAKNDSKIKVFIDKKQVAEFMVKNHVSGTANFSFKSPKLTDGRHLMYITATDPRGKESSWSNIVYFNVSKPFQPAISDEAAAEINPDAKAGQDAEKKSSVDADKAVIIEGIDSSDEEADKRISEETDREKESDEGLADADKDLEEILNSDNNEAEASGGLLDESQNSQGKLEWNLIIFLLFLAAVIAWIFWVNRELIKERREKESPGDGDNN